MRYVAFLRAINVGGHVLKMDRLRAIFTELGIHEVTTFIASGNVLFTSSGKAASLEKKIEKQLEETLRYATATFLRTHSEVKQIAESVPSVAGETLYVGFLKERPAAAAIEKVGRLSNATDRLEVAGRELYWTSRKGLGASVVTGASVERALGMPMTMRNVTTVKKIAALFEV